MPFLQNPQKMDEPSRSTEPLSGAPSVTTEPPTQEPPESAVEDDSDPDFDDLDGTSQPV